MGKYDLLVMGGGALLAYMALSKANQTVSNLSNIIPNTVSNTVDAVQTVVNQTQQSVANDLQAAYIAAINAGSNTSNGVYPTLETRGAAALFELGLMSAADYEKYVNATVGFTAYTPVGTNVVTATQQTVLAAPSPVAVAPANSFDAAKLPMGTSITNFYDAHVGTQLQNIFVSGGFVNWTGSAINDYAMGLRNSWVDPNPYDVYASRDAFGNIIGQPNDRY